MGGLLSSVHRGPGLHASKTPSFPVKTGKETELTSFEQFLQTRCPSLSSPFQPPVWLQGGHLQTVYCVLGDFSNVDKVDYDRKLLQLIDGGTIGLDFTLPNESIIYSDETPIVVVLHGLTGGSHESYVRAILAPATAPVERGGLGYRGVVMNFRGCAGTPITSPQLYSAGHTDDIRQSLLYISHLYPKAPLLGVGFSLGANVLIRYLAEEGEQSRLIAGCALGCPWNLRKNNERLESNWFYRKAYSCSMAQNLCRLVKMNLKDLSQFPDAPAVQAFPDILKMDAPLLREFDDIVTRRCGGSSPPFPFPSADAYYKWASSDYVLPKVRVPLLAINSGDDPIVRCVPEDGAGNEWVALVVTEGGGHLGWFEAGEGWARVTRWIKKPVLEWLRAAAEEVAVPHRTVPELYEADGWLKVKGRDDLGCRAIEGGGRVIGVEGEGGLFAGL